jgi:hypothetical protein
MAFQSVEMRKLTDQLESQTETFLEFQEVYETKKRELMEDLEADNIDRLQEYDLMLFKCAYEDKTKAYHDIQVTREEIKLRELFEQSQIIPKNTVEYCNVFIAFWEQKLEVIRIRNGEYSYNSYKPVANYQISKAKDELKRLSRLSTDNKNISVLSDGEDA